MRLLVLGGTRFVGRHIVAAAIERGHAVTLLTRGVTNPDCFAGRAERLTGDRATAGGLDALRGRTWDAVIDVSGYFPDDVRASARRLAPAADRYLFVSSTAVYADFSRPGLTEEAPLADAPSGGNGCELNGETYGAYKAICEQAVLDAFGPARAAILRPGQVGGPHEAMPRYVYWADRIARGGDALAPGAPERAVQVVDARDLAAFALLLLERQQDGVYNVVGPAPGDGDATMGGLLAAIRSAAAQAGRGGAALTWVADDWLAARGLSFRELPMWAPETPATYGQRRIDDSRARAAGLTRRPAERTAADTLAWLAADPHAASACLSDTLRPERERGLLAQWRATATAPAGAGNP